MVAGEEPVTAPSKDSVSEVSQTTLSTAAEAHKLAQKQASKESISDDELEAGSKLSSKTSVTIVVPDGSPPEPAATGEYCTRKGCFSPEDAAIQEGLPGSSRSTRKSISQLAARGTKNYLSEFASPVAQLLQKDVPAVREAVGAADVVLYSLEGCAFCATATTLLDARKIAYTAYYPKGKEVTDLKTTLGVPIMAFPAIFVRGRYIGSFDKLEDASNTGLLDELLALPMDPLAKLPDPMKLFVAARGGSIFSFQRYLYGNWVRLWHLIQLVSFFAFLALNEMEGMSWVMTGWAYFLVFDWVVFIALGPVPAPLGTLCLLIVWKFRGPAVPAVPYKIRQFGYVTLINGMMYDRSLNTLEQGVLFGHIINSGFITFFRF
jgi:glutaredoxin